MTNDDPLLTPKEAAEFLHTSENTLRSMRSIGRGPRFEKPNGWHVMYRRGELAAYHAKCLPSRRRAVMDNALEMSRAASSSTSTQP